MRVSARTAPRSETGCHPDHQGAAGHLTFCLKPCNSNYSKFNAISPDGKSLICSNCISYLGKRIGLLDTLGADWPGREAALLKASMEGTIAGQPGSLRMKRVAVGVALRICRHCALSYEARRSSRKVPEPPHMPVKGKDGEAFFGLMSRAVGLGGIVALATTAAEYESGRAHARLLKTCHNERLMAEYSVLFVKDGPVFGDESLGRVFAEIGAGWIFWDRTGQRGWRSVNLDLLSFAQANEHLLQFQGAEGR